MPETATAPAPAAAPAAPAQPPSTPAPPASRVGQPAHFTNSEAGKKALANLRSRAVPPDAVGRPAKARENPAPEPPKPPEKAPAETPEPPKPAEATPTPPAEKTAPEPPAASVKGGKESPWKLVESFKNENKSLKLKMAELEAKATAAPDHAKRADAAETRLKELEAELRYSNYSKTQEFKEKYQEPYERAWKKAVGDVKQLTVTENGAERPANENDLWQIITQPLGPATKLAKEMFGDDLGNYVMSNHYAKVRDLAEAQQDALDRVKKEGADREQAAVQETAKLHAEVAQAFEQIRDRDSARLEFLQEKPEDDEWNSALAHASQFVDESMRSSAFDRKLTPEQRRDRVARQIAVRNRAIGYEMKNLEIKRLRAELAERDKKIASFEKAQPGGGDARPADSSSAAPAPGGLAASLAALRSRARPID